MRPALFVVPRGIEVTECADVQPHELAALGLVERAFTVWLRGFLQGLFG